MSLLQSEVIVCPIHPSFDMKRGFLSTSIMNAGGEVIQQQLTSFFKSTTVKFGKVVHTTGGRLFGGRCKAIFHISLPLWKVDEGKVSTVFVFVDEGNVGAMSISCLC